MTDGTDTGAREQGRGKVELRISLSGTHTRRDDLEALNSWLREAPAIEEALARNEVTLTRKDSLTQIEAMGGELIQDIILVVSVELARSVSENAWRSVETWLRNRRRFADPGETPRVTLDGPAQGPGSDLSRDTDRDPAPGPVADPDSDADPASDPGTAPGSDSVPGPDGGPQTGPGAGGRGRTHGGDEPGEV